MEPEKIRLSLGDLPGPDLVERVGPLDELFFERGGVSAPKEAPQVVHCLGPEWFPLQPRRSRLLVEKSFELAGGDVGRPRLEKRSVQEVTLDRAFGLPIRGSALPDVVEPPAQEISDALVGRRLLETEAHLLGGTFEIVGQATGLGLRPRGALLVAPASDVVSVAKIPVSVLLVDRRHDPSTVKRPRHIVTRDDHLSRECVTESELPNLLCIESQETTDPNAREHACLRLVVDP